MRWPDLELMKGDSNFTNRMAKSTRRALAWAKRSKPTVERWNVVLNNIAEFGIYSSEPHYVPHSKGELKELLRLSVEHERNKKKRANK